MSQGIFCTDTRYGFVTICYYILLFITFKFCLVLCVICKFAVRNLDELFTAGFAINVRSLYISKLNLIINKKNTDIGDLKY